VLPGDFGQGTTGTDVTMGDVQNGYSVVLYSADRTGKQYIGFSGAQHAGEWNDFVYRSPDAAADYDNASDLDFVFIRAGVDAKTHPFSADYNSAVVDTENEIWLTGFNGAAGWSLHSGDEFGPIGTVSYDLNRQWPFTVEWNCPACGQNPCDTLQTAKLHINLMSRDGAGTFTTSADVESVDFAVYIPCDTYEKRWQVIPQNLNCLTDGVVETPVHYLDMVLYGTSVAGSHALDLGPYVIDGTSHTERFNTTHKLWGPTAASITGITESDRLMARGDWVAERILNKGTYLARALADNRFMWSAVKETSYDASGYQYRILGHAYASHPAFAYLMDQDKAATHAGWYSFLHEHPSWTTSQVRSLSPGFALYYGRFGENFVDQNGTELNVLMDFDATAATNDFCQTTNLLAKRWGDANWCYEWDCSATCVRIERRWVDDAMLVDLSNDLGVASKDMGVYWADADLTDICGEDDPCGSQEFFQQVADTTACAPAGTTLCRAVSLDMWADWSAACPITIYDGKTFFQPVKVTFELNQNHICDPVAKADIIANVANIDGTALNKGPIDFFMEAGNAKRLTFGVYGYDGNWYNLGYLADAFFASADKTAKPWLGMKNFFEVWPESADRTKSVKAAWAAKDKLDFSFYAVLVAGTNPLPGGKPVHAKDGYFVIYTGELSTPKVGPTVNPISNPTPVEHPYFPKNAEEINPTRIQTVFGVFTGFTAEFLPCTPVTPTPSVTVTPTTAPVTPTTAPVTPTTAPSGSSSGGGCNVGLAPLALVLLAPLALFLKK